MKTFLCNSLGVTCGKTEWQLKPIRRRLVTRRRICGLRPRPHAVRDYAIRNGRWAGYRHLLWARILELKREPEVVFWVFIFPLLLAAGLGIAFRNKPADVTSVVVIDGAGAQKTLAMLQSSDKSTDRVRAKCGRKRFGHERLVRQEFCYSRHRA